ncbi:MAG: peroxiredoxin Q/BCP [Myxococcota bacterium]|jgi:peroxiredoxin Q/BCP
MTEPQTIEAGVAAPDFTAPTDGKGELTLSSLQGKTVVLYFYPKDSTPGCTKEAVHFKAFWPDFSGINAVIIGVSKDSVKRHDNFKAKYHLPFRLVADNDGSICDTYQTWVTKKMYGREYKGIERSTFLIDKKGVIKKVWRKIKVKGHVEAVLEAASAL